MNLNELLTVIVQMLSRAPLVYLAGVAFTATSLSWMRELVHEQRYKTDWPYICVILLNGFVPTILSIPESPVLAQVNPAFVMLITPLIIILEYALITRDKFVVYLYFIGVIMLQYACFFGIGATIVTSIDVPDMSVSDNLFRSSTLTFTMYLLSFAIALYALFTKKYKKVLYKILHDWTSGSTLFIYMVLNGIVLGVISGFDYGIYFSDNDINPLRGNIINGMILRYILILITSYAIVYIQCKREINKTRAQRFEEASLRDPLTGLLNRAGGEKFIQNYINRTNADNSEDKGVLFMIDLDKFKSINDNLGHPVGDEVLIKASAVIKSLFRDSDYICRLGGDEFCVFLTGECSDSLINSKVTKLNECLRFSYDNPNGGMINTSASIGIATFPEHGSTYEELYSHADLALYESKTKGRDCFTVYNPSIKDS